ncbi:MAG: putative thiol-disulfide isomerase and thioredoxin [Acidobacteria bacterium]|nr:putative thiol-disulfide isomerase and thioredoxin [Acidobacteriota bacterium]
MNFYLRRAFLLLFFVVILLLPPTACAQASATGDENDLLPTPSAPKDLYPADADANKEIKAALKRAGVVHKRVLLVFGGNWCYDCHVLDRGLHEGAAGKILKESFELVHVDIGEADKNLDLTKKYSIPLEKGVPAVAVLSSDGKLIYSSGSGEFEAARSMKRKDLVAFLARWQEGKTP